MDRQLLEPSQMDGKLTYRFDTTGRQVALLPARCKLGRHTLGHSQFRAIVRDGETHISCLACATDTADHFWRLAAMAPAPDLAELSEELYFDLVRSRSLAALSSTGGQRAYQPLHHLGGRRRTGRRPVVTGVFVSLDRLFARWSSTGRVIATGLDLTGVVKGQLHGRFPSVAGDWLGVVNYAISYADGRRDKLYVSDQLVPFHALRLRG